jgi:hypothetical protein
LTNSGYHKESWSPVWTIEQMLIGFYSIFIVDLDHGISHIKQTPQERKILAENSIPYNLKHHPDIFKNFNQFVNEDGVPLCLLEQKVKEEVKNEVKEEVKNEVKEEVTQKVKDDVNNVAQNINNKVNDVVQSEAIQEVNQKTEEFKPTKIPFFRKIGTVKKHSYANLTEHELLNLVKKMSIRTFEAEPFETLHSKHVFSLSSV